MPDQLWHTYIDDLFTHLYIDIHTSDLFTVLQKKPSDIKLK